MSYCRFTGPESKARMEAWYRDELGMDVTVEVSDVYVFHNVSGYLECCACGLEPAGGSFYSYSRLGMVRHLELHVSSGHAVPLAAMNALVEEAQTLGDDTERDHHGAAEGGD